MNNTYANTRHAGLDPASRFFFTAASKGSGTPGQVRADGGSAK